MDDCHKDYTYLIDCLASGSAEQFEELTRLVNGFPHKQDEFLGRWWITNAIHCGSRLSIEWMIAKGVDLTFRDEEGYSVLHSALERTGPDKYEILTILLAAGAPLGLHGINDWTPAHMAAARNDVKALELFVKHGADLSIRTRIDGYATVLEEAKCLKCWDAVKYLEEIA